MIALHEHRQPHTQPLRASDEADKLAKQNFWDWYGCWIGVHHKLQATVTGEADDDAGAAPSECACTTTSPAAADRTARRKPARTCQ